MLKIDPEFEALWPPQSADEYQALLESIRTEGLHEPITTWGGVIIDGHHRYRACQELRVHYTTQELPFQDRAHVLQWIARHQRARRNLTDDQVVASLYLAGQLAELPPGLQRWGQPTYLADLDGLAPIDLLDVQTGRRTLRGVIQQARRREAPKAPKAPKAPTRQAKRANQAARVQLGRHQDRIDILEAQLAAITAPQATPVHIAFPDARSGRRPATAVALLSDVHAGEVVKQSSAHTNTYNREICELRLHRFFTGVDWLVNNNRSWAQLDTLVLWLGGDLLTGHLHPELAETSESAIQTLTWLEPLLLGGIQALQGTIGVQIVCSYGNHGRDTDKPRRSTGAVHSHEWGMYQRLARQLTCPVLADDSAHQYLQVGQYTLHFHHGDELKYQGGVGGIMIPANKAVAQWDRVRRADIHHFGHYHQYLDAGHIVFNGSLKGYDAYAMSVKATPEVPKQAFYILDATRGKTACSPVWVAE